MTSHSRGGVRPVQDLLAGQPQRHPPLGFTVGGVGKAGPHAGVGVVRGLQQARYPVRVVAADGTGGFLQAHEGPEPIGQHVVVAVPPAGLAGLPGQGQEGVDLGRVGDAVRGQQALDGQRLEAAFGAFHPADRPGGGVDRLGGLLVGQAGLLPQGLKLFAQDHAERGRGAAWPVLTHVAASCGPS